MITWENITNKVTTHVCKKDGVKIGHIHSTYSLLYPYEAFWNASKNAKYAKTLEEAKVIIEQTI